MTALPAAADFTGAAITEGQFKTAITDQRAFLAGLFGADGTQATALATLGAILNGTLSKSAAYTVVAGDRGKLIDATTGTWTLALTAAATLGAGFAFAVKNSGAGVITIDPNGSEAIDGATTITLAAGESCLVLCDGTAFVTVSKAAALTAGAIATALGYTPLAATAEAIAAALTYTPGPQFVPAGDAVGSIAYATITGETGAAAPGNSYTCSTNNITITNGSTNPGFSCTGTWKCLSWRNGGGLFQRTA